MKTKDHNIRKKNQVLQAPEVRGFVKIALVEGTPAGVDATPMTWTKLVVGGR